MMVSMIIATLNREEEILKLLKSIEAMDYDKKKIEVIVLNQGRKELKEKIFIFKNLNLKYYESNILGLSKNRNIGIKDAKGEIICFPDDDCEFQNDTLKKVVNIFKEKKEIDILLGRIIDEYGDDCIRRWPRKKKKITKYNFYTKTTSITMFLRNNKYFFDENLGVGAKFGACEDGDYIFRLLKLKKKIEYRPEIVLYHPKAQGRISCNKAKSYGEGFGAFCKKNFNIEIIILFLGSISLYVMRCIKYRILNRELYNISKNGLKGRIEGFFKYGKK